MSKLVSQAENSSLVKTTRLIQTFSSDSRLLNEFGEWLEKTQDANIILKKKGIDGFKLTSKDILILPYLHRFKKEYVKKVLFKFAQIIQKKRGEPYTHMTLTCYRSFTIPRAIEMLRRGWNRLRSYLSKKHGKIDYLAVIEPHKDGYPHMHVLVFTHKFLIAQRKLSGLWMKYGVGRITHLKRYYNWGRDSKGMYYLSKYLSKYHRDIPDVLKFINGQTLDFKRRFVNRSTFFAWMRFGQFKTYSYSRNLSVLWKKNPSSGEWELWYLCYSIEELDHLFEYYKIRLNHRITDFIDGG